VTTLHTAKMRPPKRSQDRITKTWTRATQWGRLTKLCVPSDTTQYTLPPPTALLAMHSPLCAIFSFVMFRES